MLEVEKMQDLIALVDNDLKANQLTNPPFELLKKSSLKHLMFQTVFLLSLGSDKRMSKIHAWLNRNIMPEEDWFKVYLYPSTGFIFRKQLTKDVPDCADPLVTQL